LPLDLKSDQGKRYAFVFRILKSSEVDILADGSLDYPDDLLRELDYTVCSIHSRFGLDRQQQTERLLRAMDNRYFNILGHATGRLLLKYPATKSTSTASSGKPERTAAFSRSIRAPASNCFTARCDSI
jgi:histidinol phosphatase-like PHP family hydrolase